MRRRLRLYLDTSVFGSLFDFDDPRRIETTRSLLKDIEKGIFEAFISPLVITEISKAPESVRDDLISTIGELGLPLIYNLDALISWNYRHMVNLRTKRIVNAINLKLGYKPTEILSAEEVIGYGEMES